MSIELKFKEHIANAEASLALAVAEIRSLIPAVPIQIKCTVDSVSGKVSSQLIANL